MNCPYRYLLSNKNDCRDNPVEFQNAVNNIEKTIILLYNN